MESPRDSDLDDGSDDTVDFLEQREKDVVCVTNKRDGDARPQNEKGKTFQSPLRKKGRGKLSRQESGSQ